MRRSFALSALGVILVSVPAVAANDLELLFTNGRVTIIATDVSVGAILNEWARVGDTRFVDAEKLTGKPVHLELVDFPEADALRVLLRDVAGYVAAPRLATAEGRSRFDRVLVMATARVTSSAPARTVARQPPAPMAPAGVAQDLYFEEEPEDFDRDELEELRELLPQPFSLIDRTNQSDRSAQGADTPTTPRPGVVVTPTDQSPVFIRRPVRPQTPADSRR